jgi:hypothetical protein
MKAILESYHLDHLLVFNVLLQDRHWSTTHRRYKIRMSPQGRQFAFQVRKLLTEQTRTMSFDLLHKSPNPKLRIDFAQQMHMIWQHFKFENLARQPFRYLINDLFQMFIYTLSEHLAAILWAKDNMVFAGV